MFDVGAFLILVGLFLFGLGLVGLIRGRINWARIGTRKTAGMVIAGAFVVVLIGGALSPSPGPPPLSSVNNTSTAMTSAKVSASTAAPMSVPRKTRMSVQPPAVQTTPVAPVPLAPVLPPKPSSEVSAPPVAPAVTPAAPMVPPVAPVVTPAAPEVTPAAPNGNGSGCGPDSYVNSDGACVHDPVVASEPPPGATARCVDGTYSFSKHRRGACSNHGGVAEWL